MNDKILHTHLDRPAAVYLRQSTLKQVHEHRESTTRQYALQARAIELGWAADRVDVIDEDLGQSGTSAERRQGFQRLAEDVAHGRVGAIFALEVSRRARSSADWHRLLDLCGLADVLIVDEQAIYTPRDFDDRLVARELTLVLLKHDHAGVSPSSKEQPISAIVPKADTQIENISVERLGSLESPHGNCELVKTSDPQHRSPLTNGAYTKSWQDMKKPVYRQMPASHS